MAKCQARATPVAAVQQGYQDPSQGLHPGAPLPLCRQPARCEQLAEMYYQWQHLSLHETRKLFPDCSTLFMVAWSATLRDIASSCVSLLWQATVSRIPPSADSGLFHIRMGSGGCPPSSACITRVMLELTGPCMPSGWPIIALYLRTWMARC